MPHFFKEFSSFVLCLVSLLGLFLVSLINNIDITGTIPTVLAIYIGGRSVVQSSAHWAASKDPNADTQAVIKVTNDA